MNMKTTFVSTALVLLCAGTAQAKEYGEAGTISLTGAVDLNSNTEDLDDGGKTTTTTIALRPEVGFYLMKHLELLGGLELASSTEDVEDGDKTTTTGVGVNAGAGYFFEAGRMHLGPVLLVGYGTETEKVDGTDGDERTESGPGASVQLQLKTVVGGGGLVTMGLGYDYEQLELELKSGGATLKDDGTRSGPRIFLGIGVFF